MFYKINTRSQLKSLKCEDEEIENDENEIIDETTDTPDTRVTQENMLEDIKKMLNNLMPKEREVLIMRYGLNNNGEKKTLDEIGSFYGVSRERIRQIENRAISKLKKMFGL